MLGSLQARLKNAYIVQGGALKGSLSGISLETISNISGELMELSDNQK